MKRRIYFLATLLLCSLAVFTACGDDNPITGEPENPDTPKDATKTLTVDATAYNKWVYINLADGSSVSKEIEPIAGTYSGEIAVSVGGKDQGTSEGLKLEATRNSGNQIDFVLNDFEFGKYGMIGDIKSQVTVTIDSIKGRSGYVLAGSGEIETIGNYNVKTTITSGHVIGKEIELTMSMIMGSMPMPVIVTYKGSLEKGVIDETSFTWDIAIHRYDVKTNGGSGVETSTTEIDKLTLIPADGYIADAEIDTIMIDNTNMMKGKIGYATGYVNQTLSKWMNVDTNNMPPTYTMSGKVYVLKTAAGKYAVIKFTDFTNDSNVKGHITFDYIFPAE